MTTGSKKNILKNRPPNRPSVFHGNKVMDRRKKAMKAYLGLKDWVNKYEPEMAWCFDTQPKDQRPLKNWNFLKLVCLKWKKFESLSLLKQSFR